MQQVADLAAKCIAGYLERKLFPPVPAPESVATPPAAPQLPGFEVLNYCQIPATTTIIRVPSYASSIVPNQPLAEKSAFHAPKPRRMHFFRKRTRERIRAKRPLTDQEIIVQCTQQLRARHPVIDAAMGKRYVQVFRASLRSRLYRTPDPATLKAALMRVQNIEWAQIYPQIWTDHKCRKYRASYERDKLRRNTNAYLGKLGPIPKGVNVNAWIKDLPQDQRDRIIQLISVALDQKTGRNLRGTEITTR